MFRVIVVAITVGLACSAASGDESSRSRGLSIACFNADITPPVGHPMNGGYSPPVKSIEDRVEAKGVILQQDNQRYVLCALDW